MSDPLFKGVITALVTPFREGAVDEDAFRRLVARQVEAGVQGLVPVGTTGESATLSPAEKRRLIEVCVETVNGRIPVLAGCGSASTAEALEFVRAAREAGADAALVVTPYYNRPSQEGLFQHFRVLAEAGPPVVLYNVPSRTGSDLAPETVARLSRVAGVVGVKEATGDLGRSALLRLACVEGFSLLSGDDPSALGFVAQGGHGVISVTSNVAPRACVQRIAAGLRGDRAAATAAQDRLIRLDRALFADASPSPTKFALERLGLCREEVRLPLTPCAEPVRAVVEAAMDAAGEL